jgi:hypothetical protein
MSALQRQSGRKEFMWAARVSLVFLTAASGELLLYLAWHHIDDNDPFPSFEIQLAVVASISIFLMPHTLGALARNRRPTLYLPAGIIGVLLTVASTMSPVLLIFTVPLVLVPSGVYLARTRFSPPPRMGPELTAAVLVALAIGSVWALFLRNDDSRCYYRARLRNGREIHRVVRGNPEQLSLNAPSRQGTVVEESGCSSDITTYNESLLSLGLHASLLLLARRMADPASIPGCGLPPSEGEAPPHFPDRDDVRMGAPATRPLRPA